MTESSEGSSRRSLGNSSAYSARVQEAMRYDKLPSSTYFLAMTILNAVAQGWSEERWKEGQQRTLNTLSNQPPDPKITHADAANRYDQTISCLKDLTLWPW
jgi:hypothetical protein